MLFAVIIIIVFTASFLLMRWKKMRYQKLLSELYSCFDKRRELAPKAVRILRNYTNDNRNIADSVINARNSAATSVSVNDKLAAENILGNALKNLFAFAESNDAITSDANYIELKYQFDLTEDEIELLSEKMNIKLPNGEKHDI